MKEVAREKQFLPVLYDMSGVLVILMTGQIGWIDYGPFAHWKEESDTRVNRIAWFLASQKYSELKELLPKRPGNALSCQVCKGKGKIEHPSNGFMCKCGGLGWILPG